MIYKIAEFKVRKDKVEDVKKIIKEFVVLVGSESRTITYDTYLKGDGQSFLHYMVFDSDEAQEFHKNTAYMQAFTSKLYPLCEVEPVFTDLYKF